jgi:excisionase family DNA binding protein
MSKKPNEPKHPKKPKTPKDIAIPLSERLTLTVNEFCSLVGLGRSTVYKAIKDRDLKLSKYGKRSFIKREEMLRFVGKM